MKPSKLEAQGGLTDDEDSWLLEVREIASNPDNLNIDPKDSSLVFIDNTGLYDRPSCKTLGERFHRVNPHRYTTRNSSNAIFTEVVLSSWMGRKAGWASKHYIESLGRGDGLRDGVTPSGVPYDLKTTDHNRPDYNLSSKAGKELPDGLIYIFSTIHSYITRFVGEPVRVIFHGYASREALERHKLIIPGLEAGEQRANRLDCDRAGVLSKDWEKLRSKIRTPHS